MAHLQILERCCLYYAGTGIQDVLENHELPTMPHCLCFACGPGSQHSPQVALALHSAHLGTLSFFCLEPLFLPIASSGFVIWSVLTD